MKLANRAAKVRMDGKDLWSSVGSDEGKQTWALVYYAASSAQIEQYINEAV